MRRGVSSSRFYPSSSSLHSLDWFSRFCYSRFSFDFYIATSALPLRMQFGLFSLSRGFLTHSTLSVSRFSSPSNSIRSISSSYSASSALSSLPLLRGNLSLHCVSRSKLQKKRGRNEFVNFIELHWKLIFFKIFPIYFRFLFLAIFFTDLFNCSLST